MTASKRDWVGGRVASHVELDAADQAFWDQAGPAARFAASIELALTAWTLRHPDEPAPDLVEMLSVFADARARYLVIGGHAVSLHARPRTTKDLDLWLDAAPDNIGRTCAALRRLNKRAVGRPQDRRDVRALERAAERATAPTPGRRKRSPR